jgi:hypothetical protein
VSMAAVPSHSAIVISKLNTRLNALSMGGYVNGDSGRRWPICDSSPG